MLIALAIAASPPGCFLLGCSDEEDGGRGRFGVDMDILFEFFRYM